MATIPQKELRNHVGEVLRRAEAGERFTITVSGRPVAELGPVRARQWVSSAHLADLWATPPDPTLEHDLQALGGQTRGPLGERLTVAVLLDTSVLIAAERGPEEDAAISVVSLTELHFGVLVARDHEARALRVRRLGSIEEHFDALPFDTAAARECGRLHALVAQRGGAPRRRAMDLAIAATANVHGVPLMTYNVKDFQIIAEEVELREP